MSMEIKITRTSSPKAKPDQSNLPFGVFFTDHMFVMDYTEGKGWHDPRIEPYGPLQLDPSTMVFHYGQAIFEGMKAYKTKDGRINLFRPYANMERANLSNERLVIPPIDVDFAVEALKTLVKLESDWVPEEEGTSLYIRPFIIATDPYLGVRPSHTYKFMIIAARWSLLSGRAGSGQDLRKAMSAVKGGTGIPKPWQLCASLKAQVEAQQKNYTQVLWLDGLKRSA